jgi:hypothetical protein
MYVCWRLAVHCVCSVKYTEAGVSVPEFGRLRALRAKVVPTRLGYAYGPFTDFYAKNLLLCSPKKQWANYEFRLLRKIKRLFFVKPEWSIFLFMHKINQ